MFLPRSFLGSGQTDGQSDEWTAKLLPFPNLFFFSVRVRFGARSPGTYLSRHGQCSCAYLTVFREYVCMPRPVSRPLLAAPLFIRAGGRRKSSLNAKCAKRSRLHLSIPPAALPSRIPFQNDTSPRNGRHAHLIHRARWERAGEEHRREIWTASLSLSSSSFVPGQLSLSLSLSSSCPRVHHR